MVRLHCNDRCSIVSSSRRATPGMGVVEEGCIEGKGGKLSVRVPLFLSKQSGYMGQIWLKGGDLWC